MTKRKVCFFCGLLCLASWAGTNKPDKPTKPFSFEDIAAGSGLTVSHISSPEKRYIVESISGGVGFIDCDDDGLLDIVVVNGSLSACARAAMRWSPCIARWRRSSLWTSRRKPA